jgi:hypothetical protein
MSRACVICVDSTLDAVRCLSCTLLVVISTSAAECTVDTTGRAVSTSFTHATGRFGVFYAGLVLSRRTFRTDVDGQILSLCACH